MSNEDRNHRVAPTAPPPDAVCEPFRLLKPKPSGLRWVQSLSIPAESERWWWLERDGCIVGCVHPPYTSKGPLSAWLMIGNGDARVHTGTLADCARALVKEMEKTR